MCSANLVVGQQCSCIGLQGRAHHMLGCTFSLHYSQTMAAASAARVLLLLLQVLLFTRAGPQVQYECLTVCHGGTPLGLVNSPAMCCSSGGGGYRRAGAESALDCQSCVGTRLEPLTFSLEQDFALFPGGSGFEPYEGSGCEGDCGLNAKCLIEEDGFKCMCLDGFVGSNVPGTCRDIDECTEGLDNCSMNAMCENVMGTFQCTCNTGYKGDGVTCSDINECCEGTHNCRPGTVCVNTAGGFNCFPRLPPTIDECALGIHNCHAQADCINTEDGFECVCRSGYTGDGVNCRVLINECDMKLDNCHPHAKCIDTEVGFECVCLKGYRGNGQDCRDINECAERIDNCDRRRYLTFTSRGFHFHRRGVCTNTMGGFRCSCNSGLKISSGTQCTDIDECRRRDLNDCDFNAVCCNLLGTYYCKCKKGYVGDGIHCCISRRPYKHTGTGHSLHMHQLQRRSRKKSRKKKTKKSDKSRRKSKSRSSKKSKSSQSRSSKRTKAKRTSKHNGHGVSYDSPGSDFC